MADLGKIQALIRNVATRKFMKEGYIVKAATRIGEILISNKVNPEFCYYRLNLTRPLNFSLACGGLGNVTQKAMSDDAEDSLASLGYALAGIGVKVDPDIARVPGFMVKHPRGIAKEVSIGIKANVRMRWAKILRGRIAKEELLRRRQKQAS